MFCFVVLRFWKKKIEAFKWEIKGNFNRNLLMCFGQDVCLLGRILFPSVSCMVFFGGRNCLIEGFLPFSRVTSKGTVCEEQNSGSL